MSERPDDPCPLTLEEAAVVAANDEPICMVVVCASGWVTTEYVAGLDTIAGLEWLDRRLAQASQALGAPACRVPSTDSSLVCQGSGPE